MKKIRTAPLLLLTLLAALAAAGQTFAQNKETVLRLHGSNTIGAKLAPDLAAAFLKKLGADAVKQIDRIPGTEMDIEGHFPGTEQTKVIEIRAHGSSTAFKGLKDKQCDIGMASRKIKDSEVNELSFLGDMTGSACEHVLAMDGVAVIVNPSNAAVSKLNVSDLASILSGKINDWSELSWGSAPISIQARDENSGTHDTVKGIVLGEKKFSGSAKRWDSNEMLSDAVSADANAIGYCGMPYVKSNKALEIADGGSFVQPTVFTVGTEDYPLSRRLYFYAPAAPENRHVQDFIAFALSDEGQELVRKHKFVDLTVSAKEHQIKLTPGTNEKYQVLHQYMIAVRGAKRLSANFRFKGETLELDNRALRDLERLAAFLSENTVRQITLAGFSDRHEDSARKIEGSFDSNYAQNLELSCKRAEVVKEELRSRGITVADVLCVGSEMPMASNATATGREKNRRVEVWVR
jgi:phosphate transport system substrate-binding protein